MKNIGIPKGMNLLCQTITSSVGPFRMGDPQAEIILGREVLRFWETLTVLSLVQTIRRLDPVLDLVRVVIHKNAYFELLSKSVKSLIRAHFAHENFFENLTIVKYKQTAQNISRWPTPRIFTVPPKNACRLAPLALLLFPVSLHFDITRMLSYYYVSLQQRNVKRK